MLSTRITENWIFTYTNTSHRQSCRVSEIGSVKRLLAEVPSFKSASKDVKETLK